MTHACAHSPHSPHIPNKAPWWMNYYYSNEMNLSTRGERKKKKWWTQRILSIFDFSSYPSFICGFVISLLFVTHQLKRTFRNSEPVYFPLSKPFGAFLLGLANWRVFNCPTWRTQCIKWSFSFHGEKIPGHTEMWIIEFCTLWLMVLCRHGIELNDLQCSLEYRNFYWF